MNAGVRSQQPALRNATCVGARRAHHVLDSCDRRCLRHPRRLRRHRFPSLPSQSHHPAPLCRRHLARSMLHSMRMSSHAINKYAQMASERLRTANFVVARAVLSALYRHLYPQPPCRLSTRRYHAHLRNRLRILHSKVALWVACKCPATSGVPQSQIEPNAPCSTFTARRSLGVPRANGATKASVVGAVCARQCRQLHCPLHPLPPRVLLHPFHPLPRRLRLVRRGRHRRHRRHVYGCCRRHLRAARLLLAQIRRPRSRAFLIQPFRTPVLRTQASRIRTL